MLLGPIGPKIQVLLSPPIQGGPRPIFRGPPPLQGALAKFRPVTIVYIGATIAKFLVALFYTIFSLGAPRAYFKHDVPAMWRTSPRAPKPLET